VLINNIAHMRRCLLQHMTYLLCLCTATHALFSRACPAFIVFPFARVCMHSPHPVPVLLYYDILVSCRTCARRWPPAPGSVPTATRRSTRRRAGCATAASA
jgi:hypothetical protein